MENRVAYKKICVLHVKAIKRKRWNDMMVIPSGKKLTGCFYVVAPFKPCKMDDYPIGVCVKEKVNFLRKSRRLFICYLFASLPSFSPAVNVIPRKKD